MADPVSASSRRGFLRTLLGAGLVAAGIGVLRSIAVRPTIVPDWRDTWEALLDTLIPDGELPGWRATGIETELRRLVAARRDAARAVVRGLTWLDREARRRHGTAFALLAARERSAIVATSAAAADGTVEKYLYRTVRDHGMRLHYSRRAAWRAAGLPHPPQPDGYPEYARAPRG